MQPARYDKPTSTDFYHTISHLTVNFALQFLRSSPAKQPHWEVGNRKNRTPFVSPRTSTVFGLIFFDEQIKGPENHPRHSFGAAPTTTTTHE